MRLPLLLISIVSLGLLIGVAPTGFAQRGTTPPTSSPGAASDATARIVAKDRALLSTLDDAGRAKVQFPFEGPQKTRWSNFPNGIFQRQGLRMGDLTPAQRAVAMRLLETALSQAGYRKVTEIVGADEVLRTTAGAGAPRGGPPRAGRGGPGRGGPGGGGLAFGEDEYYLAFVGTPSVTSPWMLQFGGLANALVPESDRVAIGAQRRVGDQRELTIDYALGAAPAIPRTVWLFGSLAATTALLALVMRTSPRP